MAAFPDEIASEYFLARIEARKVKFDKTKFSELNVLDYEQFGSVAKLIVKGNKEEIISKLRSMNPVLLETLDLSLEEKLVYEMGDDSNEK